VVVVLVDSNITRGEFSVTFLDDADMKELNARWLGREYVTDVISFALQDEGEPPVGDIYVGREQAARQADDLGHPLDEELVRLVIHGTLHVLGHDHPEDAEESWRSPMFRLQEDLVRRVLAGASPGVTPESGPEGDS
jgi:probable rRNA maturation factor